MKRVELLEALFLQGKKMRDLQVLYISIRGKGIGGHDTAEGREVLEQIDVAEVHFDKMVMELDEWWEKHEEPVLDSARTDSGEVVIPEGWMVIKNQEDPVDGRYVDVLANNGKQYPHIFFDMYFHYHGQFLSDDLSVVAWTYSETLNDGDDDIRI